VGAFVMRHTQPLTADEQRIDAALAAGRRSHAERDKALTAYRYALRTPAYRARELERVADILLGEGAGRAS
jgi:hypothetical protein